MELDLGVPAELEYIIIYKPSNFLWNFIIFFSFFFL